MTEWLAKNVLGWKFEDSERPQWRCPGKRFTHGPDQLTRVWSHKLCDLIYSPDGFFAVWDAVIKKFPYLEIAFSITAYESICCVFTNHDDGDADWMFNQFGKDRYEAFYSAVYEAMNEKIKM